MNEDAPAISTITNVQQHTLDDMSLPNTSAPLLDNSIINDYEHNYSYIIEDYWDIGLPTFYCAACGALMWSEERLKKDVRSNNPMFSLCCMQGKVQLPLLKDPPQLLKNLLTNHSAYSSNFLRNISVKERVGTSPSESLKLRLVKHRKTDGRTYNLPTSSEIAVLIVGDIDSLESTRDIVVEMQSGLADAVIRGDVNPSSQGKRIILPSSFTGGFRYKFQNFHDAMTICQKRGYPNLFITFTCNPKWQEIEQFTNQRGLKPTDRPDILCRVFKIKLDRLVDDLMKDKYFGRVIGLIYTVEFQKRGLLHAHIVVFLHPEDTYNTPNDIDSIISAEIPDNSTYPTLREDVKNFMLHGPCGVGFDSSPCMRDGKCTKHFPNKFVDKTVIDEEGFPQYKRRDNGVSVEKNDVPLDNIFVVPYNARLLSKYKAHINVEYCNQHKSIKYLFKYVNKGEDRVTAAFYSNGNKDGQVNDVDEIKITPSVERLSFHLPREQSIVFRDDEPIDSVVQRNSHRISMFLAWFEANKKYPKAKLLTYSDFPSQFTYKSDSQEWTPRKRGSSIGRLLYVPPGSGELYYMRILLNICKGATSYQDIRTIDGILYPTFKDACYSLDYPSMPIPDDSVVVHRTNRLLLDELSYDRASLCTEHEILMSKLTEEQTNIYHTIIDAIDLNLGGVFFLYGFGGSGKTFVWNTLSTGLRSKGNIVLNVASSGIASLLLPGGRTAHSRFCIPIDISEVSICNIKQGSDLSELLFETKLIIWDEAPMANKYCFEALDRTMRDVLRFSNPLSKNLPFGGKVVVFGGDFRQILPVIPKTRHCERSAEFFLLVVSL
ncbi:ATP-dependent DNA helicase PIF1 [Senna tora]|uniref:ATP-dependent DNA helicase n=1 Tax=Senna tora TaxID=362788 RepID=A0A834WN77_9FABA|nr:ATP-dependent DNA helicase PIF1 [Senna tora]